MSKVVKVSKTLAKPTAAKRKAGKYQMPEPLPNGEILTDLTKKQWKLGPSIGKGGFGEIYSATDVKSSGKDSYVIKIEPKENGPLFVEMHFFMKVCKTEDIDQWMKKKNIKFLGLPRFVGNGSHQHNGKPYRFVVMEKFGKNLDAVLKENKNTLASDYIFKIAVQVLDSLEYIHSKGYVHADIKGGNLLLGLKKGTEDKVYLVDFGLASKYSSDFKPDPKCAHNGTIEFISRDAHVGAMTRRGDLEILAYNMLRWFTAQLPWENKLTDCAYVQQQKLKFMCDIPELLQKCFGSRSVPDALKKYFEYVSVMAPTSSPDYDLCRNVFQEALKAGTTSEKKAQVISPKREHGQPSASNLKKVKNENKLEIEEVQKVDRKRKSPVKTANVEKRKSPVKTVNVEKRKSPVKTVNVEKQSIKNNVDSKSSRPPRAARKVNYITNGYVSESDSFSDDDYEYAPSKSSKQKKSVKRPISENTGSPKKKRS